MAENAVSAILNVILDAQIRINYWTLCCGGESEIDYYPCSIGSYDWAHARSTTSCAKRTQIARSEEAAHSERASARDR